MRRRQVVARLVLESGADYQPVGIRLQRSIGQEIARAQAGTVARGPDGVGHLVAVVEGAVAAGCLQRVAGHVVDAIRRHVLAEAQRERRADEGDGGALGRQAVGHDQWRHHIAEHQIEEVLGHHPFAVRRRHPHMIGGLVARLQRVHQLGRRERRRRHLAAVRLEQRQRRRQRRGAWQPQRGAHLGAGRQVAEVEEIPGVVVTGQVARHRGAQRMAGQGEGERIGLADPVVVFALKLGAGRGQRYPEPVLAAVVVPGRNAQVIRPVARNGQRRGFAAPVVAIVEIGQLIADLVKDIPAQAGAAGDA